jgi:hypothetical protein
MAATDLNGGASEILEGGEVGPSVIEDHPNRQQECHPRSHCGLDAWVDKIGWQPRRLLRYRQHSSP